MNPTVSVKFKKSRDYSNEYKDFIIFALPGPYRVSREVLNDMSKGGSHNFEFKSEEVAAKFAKDLFSRFNNVLDVTTNFIVK
ncbi:hypothetical protein F9U44_00380 [Pectobacterium versatile]|uniref:hypothetical protein n=1 Tax=Pectobacterium versatile TaxID=2488639 RepID=UPI001B3A2BF5|nr:hypothetical protein [Pectobacterium versatile]MBQ4769929.1 hypothetical protein [Pectobacterium versatile]